MVGLVLQDGLVDGETDAGWGGEPAQVIAGGSDARSGSAQVGPVKPLLDAACGPARVGADETVGGDTGGAGRVVLVWWTRRWVEQAGRLVNHGARSGPALIWVDEREVRRSNGQVDGAGVTGVAVWLIREVI